MPEQAVGNAEELDALLDCLEQETRGKVTLSIYDFIALRGVRGGPARPGRRGEARRVACACVRIGRGPSRLRDQLAPEREPARRLQLRA